LKEIVSGIFDCPHSTPEWTEWGVRCLRTPDLGVGYWVTGNERFVSETTYTERSRRAELLAGDIVLSREGTVGIAAVIESGFRACMGQRLVHIKPNPDKAISEYLLWYLLQVLSAERISRFMVGSTAQHLNVKDLRALPIPLPPMSKQIEFKETLRSMNSANRKVTSSSEHIFAMSTCLQHRAFRGELLRCPRTSAFCKPSGRRSTSLR
jgi:type I restriction enzyme S subunit